nr:hypothetical protein [Tanacetum cinerariifolium]
FKDKKRAEKRVEELLKQFSDLQENLYAEHRQSLLLVFQAIDTGGKDGAIRKLLTGLNPAGVQARLDDPAKRWKFEPDDLKERKLWDKYQEAFQDALNACSTPSAPWYVIPANHKWARDLAILEIVVAALTEM